MRKVVTVLVLAAALMLVTGSSASAHGGHRSCGFWGSVIIADVAVKEFHPLGQTISFFARQGGMGDDVAGFHQTFCDSAP